MSTVLRTLINIGLSAAMLIHGVVSDAETLPTKGGIDSRIRTAMYRPNEVYRLYGFVGYAIELVFEEGEVFAGNGGGDLDGIAFGAHRNHLVLKPKAMNVGTNFVIYTDRRAYRFEYSVSSRKPNLLTDEVIYTVRFIYPPKNSNAEHTDYAFAQAGSTRAHNYDYWYCGASSIKPIAASDDGVHTRLTFSAKAELPVIFIANEDGSESLLNFNVEEGDVIIHRVAARFILRRGKVTGCVVNKGFAGSGERLNSGTVAPDVWRDRKEGSP